MPSFVYMVANTECYTGVTSDLVKRIFEHKQKIFQGFTAKYGADKLVYYEVFDDILLAIQREKQIKKWTRAWKVRRIMGSNPEWSDLYDVISR